MQSGILARRAGTSDEIFSTPGPAFFNHQVLETTMHPVYEKIQALDITLPTLAVPAAAYVPYVQTGSLIFISGHIAKKDGKAWVGQLGKTMATEEGKLAARSIAIDLLGTLHAALQAQGKDLGSVKRIVKVMSLVNSTADFTEQHLVTNGCSELLGAVFGPAGAHARSAFGVAQIPMGACVEIEMIVEVA
jgi:enamine deaminase RidA (YjgF/YER057c/UK114 family)